MFVFLFFSIAASMGQYVVHLFKMHARYVAVQTLWHCTNVHFTNDHTLWSALEQSHSFNPISLQPSMLWSDSRVTGHFAETNEKSNRLFKRAHLPREGRSEILEGDGTLVNHGRQGSSESSLSKQHSNLFMCNSLLYPLIRQSSTPWLSIKKMHLLPLLPNKPCNTNSVQLDQSYRVLLMIIAPIRS